MVCKKCGTENAADAKFCVNCGETLEQVNNEGSTTVAYNQDADLNPPVQNQNYYNQPYPNQPEKEPGKGLAIASMVCGIVSFLCFPLITGILGIIFGAVAKSKGCRSGMATAGIICGAIGIALWIIMLVAGLSSLTGLSNELSQIMTM